MIVEFYGGPKNGDLIDVPDGSTHITVAVLDEYFHHPAMYFRELAEHPEALDIRVKTKDVPIEYLVIYHEDDTTSRQPIVKDYW